MTTNAIDKTDISTNADAAAEALRERIEQHNENRKAVQEELKAVCNALREKADTLERRLTSELDESFANESSRLQSVLSEVCQSKECEEKLAEAMKNARSVLAVGWICCITEDNHGDTSDDYRVSILRNEENTKAQSYAASSQEEITDALSKRFEEADEHRRKAQERVCEVCEEMRRRADSLEEKGNVELEAGYTKEESRLQHALNDLQTALSTKGDEVSITTDTTKRAEAELIVKQTYELHEAVKKGKWDEAEKEGHAVISRKEVAIECIKHRRPELLRVDRVNNSSMLSIYFSFLGTEEESVLHENGFEGVICYKALVQKKGGEGEECTLRKKEEANAYSFVPNLIEAETTYNVKVAADIQGKKSEWSEEAEFTTPEFTKCCVWKECPDYVKNVRKKYSVDKVNPRVATLIGSYWCTITGNTPLPPNKVTSWSIKILKSKRNDGGGIWVGVAPSDADMNKEHNSINKLGWYLDCYNSLLYSGPPHNYGRNTYGPRQYVHTGDSVGVVMNTTKGELSFVVNGVNLGVAYEGIPLDKPLVPCALLYCQGDTVELGMFEIMTTEGGGNAKERESMCCVQ